MKLIDKDAVLAEIKELSSAIKIQLDYKKGDAFWIAQKLLLERLKGKINSLEVKEVDDELQGIEKKVAEGSVNAIDRKRIPIVLKGEIKAKFKNEFNTLWQTIGCIQFANVSKHIIERLCLHFAAWGSYNLKGIGQINKDDKKEMDVEEKEVDLEREMQAFATLDLEPLKVSDSNIGISITMAQLYRCAKHFFELGLKAQKL